MTPSETNYSAASFQVNGKQFVHPLRSPRLSLPETTCPCKAHTEAQATLTSWHKAYTEAPATAASGRAPRQALLLDGSAVVEGICSRRQPIGRTSYPCWAV